MGVTINECCDSFRELRESGSYYVDKTSMLSQYLGPGFKKAVLFARPRRFGKTLTMTMIRDFLDIRQDSVEIFAGLEVMGHKDVVECYMNRFPVVFVSLKEVHGRDFGSVTRSFKNVVSTLCKQNVDLLQSERVDSADKTLLNRLRFRKGTIEDAVEVLDLLSRMLRAHFGKPAFVLVDEYDVPMAKALGTPHYDRVRGMVEQMLSYVCKTNENVRAVILSGCLYTVKNSAYTGVNNIIPYTILSPLYATAMGFTEPDVRGLLEDAGIARRYHEVEEWYDGYLFGRDRVFCPWDVLRHVGSVLDGSNSEAMGPKSYWVNSSETSIEYVRAFLGKGVGVTEGLERLVAGDSIDCAVTDSLPYHAIHADGENLWSALLETGYLTKDVTEEMPRMPLRIPNRSVQVAFRQEVWEFFRDRIDNAFVRDLMAALWAGEAGAAEEALAQILEATLSFWHEYHEYSYHLILSGFFTGMGYLVQSERESGYGRSDLIVLDPARSRSMVLELKHVKEKSELEGALREGTGQIVLQRYGSHLLYEGYTTRLHYAMAFHKKRARVEELHR